MITKETVLEALRTVIDPELNINIVALGLIYDVVIDQEKNDVTITMTLTTPGCPLSMVFDEWVPKAVKKIPGVKNVTINLVWEPPWNPGLMSEAAKLQLGMM